MEQMKLYIQQEDITLYGIHVKTFPHGIKESFDILMDRYGETQSYYGISWVAENGSIQYYSCVAVADFDETNTGDLERLIIPKGTYNTSTILDWMSKTESVKDVFHELMGDFCPDKERACIEWYKSDEEMLCMIRME